jgi:cell wall-associated NlpC family hydrolase
MGGLGAALIASGVWFTYCGIANVAPIRTLVNIIQNPGAARQIIKDKANKIDPLGSTAASTAAKNSSGQVIAPQTTGTGANAFQYSGKSGATIVSFARAQIGRPYIFGGTGNPGWDCSGLVQGALSAVGVSVPHSATAIYISSKGKVVKNPDGSAPSLKNLSALVPGDIVFPYQPLITGDVSHCGIYSGNGNFIEAAHKGTNVREIKLYAITGAKRFV